MSADPDDTTEIRRLVAGAFALRASALQNEIDEEAARLKRKKFVYFVDPNTVIWYCRPHERQNLSGFGSPRDASADDVAPDFPAAFKTLDFIFSGELPGGDHNPLYISRDHMEEFFEVVDKLHFPRRKRSQQGTGDQLVAAAKALRDSSDVPEDVGDLFDGIRGLMSNPILSATFASERYADMDRRKLVRRADYDDWMPRYGPTWAALSPRRAVYRDRWIDLLLPHRAHVGETKNLGRDAETLADLQLLNEMAGQGREFVLITVDRAIHMAMADWIADDKFRDRTTFVRHPRQYMPLLNLNSAPASLDIRYFMRIKAAASALAEAAEAVVPAPPQGPQAHVFASESAGDVRSENWLALAPQARNLRDEWRQAMETAVSLLIDSVAETTLPSLNHVIAQIDRQLSDESLAHVLEQVIDRQSERIVKSNRAFAISGRLLAQTAQRHAQADRLPSMILAPEVRRVDAFMQRHGAEKSQYFEDFLSDILREPENERRVVMEEFENVLIALSDVEAYAFSSYVSFRMRDWRSARYFARSFEAAAKELPQGSPLEAFAKDYLQEARHARNVADRFLLESADEIRRLRGILIKECTRNDLDQFVRARDASELAALTLVMILRAKTGQFTILESNLRELLADAERWIGHGLRWLGMVQGKASQRNQVNVQLRVNLAAVFLFRAALFDDRQNVSESEAASAALAQLARLNKSQANVHLMAKLYEHGLGIILTEDRRKRKAMREDLREALRSMGKDGAFDEEIDQRVRAWFDDFVAAEPTLA